MNNILWGDLETYCEIPINNGTHAYAEGVEVMLFAWAIGDEPVSVWDLTAGEPIPSPLFKAITDPDTLLYPPQTQIPVYVPVLNLDCNGKRRITADKQNNQHREK